MTDLLETAIAAATAAADKTRITQAEREIGGKKEKRFSLSMDTLVSTCLAFRSVFFLAVFCGNYFFLGFSLFHFVHFSRFCLFFCWSRNDIPCYSHGLKLIEINLRIPRIEIQDTKTLHIQEITVCVLGFFLGGLAKSQKNQRHYVVFAL